MLKGRFVIVCGVDGAGKTLQSGDLAKAMGATWMNFPRRSTYYGKLIDSWLEGKWACTAQRSPQQEVLEDIDAAVFQALQTCNRLECVQEMEHRLLAAENIVCDRYWPSSVAYACADGLDEKVVRALHHTLPVPDLFVLLNVSLEVARTRLSGTGKLDKYEQRTPVYHELVRNKYLEIFQQGIATNPAQWAIIDGNGTKADTQVLLQATVRHALGDWDAP